jgi:hypothetical protein
MIDDGVNDEDALLQACKELEAEGFWEDVKCRYGIKPSIVSQVSPGNLFIPGGSEREKAAIILDESLGIPHIPSEGYEKSEVVSSVDPEDSKS